MSRTGAPSCRPEWWRRDATLRRAHVDGRGEGGETLIEIVITIALVGICFVALLGGVMTSANMSGLHRSQADGDIQLVSAVEQIKAATYNATCLSPSYPVTLAAGWTPTQQVQYWNGTGFGTTCYDTAGISFLTQQITVTVTSPPPDSRVVRTSVINKRG